MAWETQSKNCDEMVQNSWQYYVQLYTTTIDNTVSLVWNKSCSIQFKYKFKQLIYFLQDLTMIDGLPQNQGLLDEVLGLGFITFYMLELDYVTILFWM